MSPHALPLPLLRAVPVVPGWDHSLQFLADPYRFIGRECRRLGSDVVQARLLLQPTLCLVGPRAAELFYDTTRFDRQSGAPARDGAGPLCRRRLSAAACGARSSAALAAQAVEQWSRLAPRWRARPRLVLYEAAQDWLARTACAWAGIPLAGPEVSLRTAQLVALLGGAGPGAAGSLQSRRARWAAEGWLGRLVQAHRRRRLLAQDSPAAAVAESTDGSGRLLSAGTAAGELLDLLRPIVAVSVFVVLAAHALHVHPGWRDRLAAGRGADLEAFVQEVRRFYPFFPPAAARVCREFVWDGWHFPRGMRALLDLYGTNRDPRAWPQPHEFRPERFFGAIPGLFDFAPHGGGRADDAHAGFGSGLTMALMKLALHQLVAHLRYQLPAQDLELRMDHLPAVPRDGLLIEVLALR